MKNLYLSKWQFVVLARKILTPQFAILKKFYILIFFINVGTKLHVIDKVKLAYF